MKIVNRKAKFEYEILDTYVAGIVLQGSEVKSIRNGRCNISDSFCIVDNNEVILKNCHISKYDSDKFTNHEELRDRKLLLTKKEILKLKEKSQTIGITIIPLKLFLQHNLIKAEIGLCKGKKLYDKRESIKERDIERELNRIKF
jgi:SsrA-binding protein